MLLEPLLPTLGSKLEKTYNIYQIVPKRRIWFAILKWSTFYFVIGKSHKNTKIKFAFRSGGYTPDIISQGFFFQFFAHYTVPQRRASHYFTFFNMIRCWFMLERFALATLCNRYHTLKQWIEKEKTQLRLMLGSMNLKMGAETNSVAVT